MSTARTTLRARFVTLSLCLLASLAFVGRSHGQSSSDCLDDIELLMREHQARYSTATAMMTPDRQPMQVNWPGCCDEANAPSYPPNGYYQSAVRSNPSLGPKLVESLRSALLETMPDQMPIAKIYISRDAPEDLDMDGRSKDALKFNNQFPYCDA